MSLTRRAILAGMAALPMARGALARSPMGLAKGPVEPNWPSLVSNYRYPDWFRDAKLGIWSHWGPQSVPEQGYAVMRPLALAAIARTLGK